MKRKWVIVIMVTGGVLVAAACKNNINEGKVHKVAADTMKMAKKMIKITYTCPMHHQIREKTPGKCPICGMTLVPIENNTSNNNPADTAVEITLSAAEQQLAGIHTDTAILAPLARQVVLTGTTIFDPQNQQVISAWVDGWIEKLYVRNLGEMIHAGQKLFDLYSPDLLSAEKDYLIALQQKALFKSASVDFTATIQAMKQKLSRWGLTPSQIDNLQHEAPTGRVTIFSKASGYLTQKLKEEGDHVNEGDMVMDIAQNNTLWVQAQLYDSELFLLAVHPKIWAEIEGRQGEKIPGKIVFNNPVNENNSRVNLLNIAIPNPGAKIQPGILAYVYLQTRGSQPAVLIPKSAVIYGHSQDYVWVRLPDGAPASPAGRFEMRMVQLGADNNTVVEVLSGVKPGDIVVSGGAYLVNSEYILRYGTGVNMAGMIMSDMKMSGKGK